MMRKALLIVSGCLCLSCSSNSTDTENQHDSTTSALEAEAIETNSGVTGGPNTLSEQEQAEGWELLFDGRNTDKWTKVGSEEFPENGWVIENDALVLAEGGNIITKEEYSDFELKFDFNFTPAANSGIKYYVTKLKNMESGAEVNNGPEYQIIDDFHHSEVKDQVNENEKSAAVYLLYAPRNKNLLPAGQWNTGRIVSKDQ